MGGWMGRGGLKGSVEGSVCWPPPTSQHSIGEGRVAAAVLLVQGKRERGGGISWGLGGSLGGRGRGVIRAGGVRGCWEYDSKVCCVCVYVYVCMCMSMCVLPVRAVRVPRI